jgi:hypothetical protein
MTRDPREAGRAAARAAGLPAIPVCKDIWYPPPRFTKGGHRAPVNGRRPVESKTLPWWTWFFEHADRLHARLMARQPQHVRDGLDHHLDHSGGRSGDPG